MHLQVRRWIKSPMVSMEKHQTSSLKYPGSTVMHIPPGEPDLESPLCQMCFSDHAFQREIVPPDTESCSWEGHRSCNVSKVLPSTYKYVYCIQTSHIHTVDSYCGAIKSSLKMYIEQSLSIDIQGWWTDHPKGGEIFC